VIDRRTLLLGLAAGALAAQAQAQQPVKLRVGVIPVMGTAPLFVAIGENWLQQAGMAPVITTFESGPNMIQAVASGTLDVYVGGVAPLAVARSKGVDIRVVAATAVLENVFVAGPKLAAYFKPGTTSAQAFHDFRAATGTPARLATQPAGSVPNTTLQYWLWEVAKASHDDVTVIPMGIDATQQAVLAGAVDGAIIREPAVSIITARNPAVKLIATGGSLFPGQPGTVVAVTGAFITAHEAMVQALVNALVRAKALIAAKPEEAIPFIQTALGKGIVDTDTIRHALASPATRFEIDPRKIIGPAEKMQDYQVTLGSLDKPVSFQGLFDTRFIEHATP
jgi:NitT/TauT family transport system substrate-binding protein